MKQKKLVLAALLAAVALILFVIEAQIPPLVPIPGVKIGLSNTVTLFALYALGPGWGMAILLCRVLLGNILSGQIMALAYSLSGSLLSYSLCLLLRRCFSIEKLWVLSVFSALMHSTGQILCALLITRTAALLWYLPVLLFVSLPTGAFTGLMAGGLLKRWQRREKS